MLHCISVLAQTEQQLNVLAEVKIRGTNCILITLNEKTWHLR